MSATLQLWLRLSSLYIKDASIYNVDGFPWQRPVFWKDSPSHGMYILLQKLILRWVYGYKVEHYNDIIMGAIASHITSLMIVYSIVYSDADQRKHQSSASLAFVRGIHRGPVNSPHKWPVTRKMFLFDDVIMGWELTKVYLRRRN